MTVDQTARGENRNLTTHGYVLKSLRDAILRGQLPGGSRLIQADLAAQLDVSITPVREALRDLAGEGFVEFDPRRGSRVRGLDVDEVRELYEIRIALEPLMVRRVIDKVTAEQLDEAEALVGEMDKASDIVEWSELNRRFHAVLAKNDRTSRLARILTLLRDSASPYVGFSLGMSAERRAESDTEHRLMLDLYRARDAEGAVATTVQHLRTTIATLEEANEAGTC